MTGWPPTLLAALALVGFAALRAWHGWLELRRLEIERSSGDGGAGVTRIEMADLRERVRKLETIAEGIDPP